MSSTFEPGGSIGSTGSVIDFVLPLEVREIAVIEGVENHESDVIAKNQYIDSLEAKLDADPSSFRDDPLLSQLSANTWGSDEQRAEQIKKSLEKQRPYSTFSYLEKTLGSDFSVDAGRKSASYLSVAQNVQYNFRIHHLLDEYKTALETPGLIVVYIGHSRYGRGPCCYDYEGKIPPQGEQWEDGTTATDGIFRMGYPYVPVEFEDMENHRYMFRPVPGEWDPPPNEFAAPKSRHPDARRSLSRITLPDDLQQFVKPEFASASNQYWGFGQNIVLNAGWNSAARAVYNLDGVDLQCRTFCQFGCSSKLHFWELVRKAEYKGWARPTPPTDRFAYFTTSLANWKAVYWLYYLLAYDQPNCETHFFDSHEYAKKHGNIKLQSEGASFLFY